jgi:hypothetical protein
MLKCIQPDCQTSARPPAITTKAGQPRASKTFSTSTRPPATLTRRRRACPVIASNGVRNSRDPSGLQKGFWTAALAAARGNYPTTFCSLPIAICQFSNSGDVWQLFPNFFLAARMTTMALGNLIQPSKLFGRSASPLRRNFHPSENPLIFNWLLRPQSTPRNVQYAARAAA